MSSNQSMINMYTALLNALGTGAIVYAAIMIKPDLAESVGSGAIGMSVIAAGAAGGWSLVSPYVLEGMYGMALM